MARVVCQVLSRPGRLTLIWSEGDAFFEPYHLSGPELVELRRRAARVREQPGGTDGFALAQAGHALYKQLLLSDMVLEGDRTREIRDWLHGLQAAGTFDSLEILSDAPGLLPWNAVYDRPPDEAAFRAGPGSEAWQGFWGVRLDLTVGRRIDPLRQLEVLEKPEVLLVVDPHLRDSLPDDQKKRLAEFVQVNGLSMVDAKEDLDTAVRQRSFDLLYLFCPAGEKGITLGNDHLTPSELRDLLRGISASDPASTTLLFLNGCRTDHDGGRVLESLHAVGLTGFIAPEQALPAEFASTQGLDFLAAFLYQGEPLGKALQRLRARTAPLGLLYTGVCPSGLRVTWRSEEEEAGTPAETPTDEPEPLPLPEEPYRPLAPYDMEDRSLFFGRDGDVEYLTQLLDREETRLLLLHGPSGVGKSSLVRAGVIPYLEEDCTGYRFLRDRSETDEEPAAEADFPVLAIRATHNLPGQIAQALCAYCASPYTYATPTGRTVVVDLPAILADVTGSPAGGRPTDQADDASAHAIMPKGAGPAPATPASVPQPVAPDSTAVESAFRDGGELLARVLGELSERLPHELVLLIEQGEEMLTLAPDPKKRRQAMDLLRNVAVSSGHFKVIVSLRTEFFGRLSGRLDQGPGAAGGLRSYLLGELDADTLAEAILLPTAREPIPYAADIPYQQYGFLYEKGLPQIIAREALDAAQEGHDSALPLVQVVCAQLADRATAREDRVIRVADLTAVGGMENAMSRYVQGLVNSVSEAPADRRALRAMLHRLVLRQADGILVRDLVPETELAPGWKGAAPADAVVDAAAEDAGLLEVTSLSYRGEEERFVSLAHDALAPLAARWAQEDERRSHTRKRVIDTLFVTVPCILLALALAYRFFNSARAAETANEEAQKVAKDLQSLKQNEEAVQKARAQNARLPSYLGYLGQARQALEAGNLVAFDQAMRGPQALLSKEDRDLRGFEWYYLWKLGHGERATLRGHRGRVTSVALAPDETVLASGSEDGTVKLWDAASGLERATLTGHKGAVYAVAISGDGKLVASAGQDGAVKLWDATTGKDAYVETDKALASLEGSGGAVHALAFSRDGKVLASAGAQKKDMGEVGAIRLWDVIERKETKVLHGHKGPIRAIAFSADGKTLASGGADHAVFLWETTTGQKKALEGHPGAVNAVAFTADGKTLASGGVGRKDGVGIGIVRLWDTDTGKPRDTFTAVPAGILALAFTPDGKQLVSGSRTNAVEIWNVAGGKERRRLQGHVGWVDALAMSSDGKTLATGSYDRTARLWDLSEGTSHDVLRAHGGWVGAVAVAPNSKLIASGGDDGTVKLWEAATGKVLQTLKGHTGAVMALAFDPRKSVLASGSWDEAKSTGELKLWDLDPTSNTFGKEQRSLQGHTKGITCVAFSPDGKTLASAGPDYNVILWDTDSGQKKHEIAASKGIVRCLAFAPDGHTLASGGNDTLIRLWDPETGKELMRKAPLDGHTAAVTALAFSPDSLTLASASVDQTVKLWDVATGASRATLRGHGGVVFAVAFSPQGETLASGSWDRTVKLWDPDTGADRYTLTGHAGPVRAVAFSPDRLFLASGSHDGTVRLWRAAPPEPVRLVHPQE